ncbi:MAG: hypothetical protein WAN46_01385 [Gammaproteobacteria bacterium]|jgi:hypothetical protein
MAGSILFEIENADEQGSELRVAPTEWLRSLPPGAQITEVKTYLRDLKGMYERTTNATEQSRLAQIITAVRDYVEKIGD